MSVQNAASRVTQQPGLLPDHLLSRLKLDEGFRQFLYRCTANKLTIGYGFNIEDEGIPEPVAAFWLQHILRQLEPEISKNFPAYRVLSDARQHVLLNMAYNLGVPRLLGFRKMLAALERNDFKTAAKEMLSSKWAEQVGMRAQRLAYAMEFGHEDEKTKD